MKTIYIPSEQFIKAAKSWWAGNRPVGWNVSMHLEHPAINCPTRRERRLAGYVAEYVRRGIERQKAERLSERDRKGGQGT